MKLKYAQISLHRTCVRESLSSLSFLLFYYQLRLDSLLPLSVFNCHFFSNFITIFLDEILPHSQPSSSSSLSSLSSSSSLSLSTSSSKYIKMFVLSASAILPHFLVIVCSYALERKGLYSLMKFLFGLKIVFSAIGYWIGRSFFTFMDGNTDLASLIFLLIYMVLAKSFNEVICRHGNLVLADIVDEDSYLHDRVTSISSLIFGVNAFFTKPGQSLAPSIGWKMISLVSSPSSSSLSSSSLGIHPMSIFLFLVCVPVVCGSIQLFVWGFFTLHSQYLEAVKNTRKMV